MEMRHLRVFIAVAEELHFGKAAERLNLSQPPISLAIKELELELGVRLLERTSRRILITHAGEEVLRDARAILARAASLRQRAHTAGMGLGGALSIGFISTAAYSFLPEMLRLFSGEFPDTKLSLHENSTDRIFTDLENGSLDVGCMFSSPQMPTSLTYQATNRYELLLALPEAHPAAKLSRVPLERLANERFLIFERHQGSVMFDTVVSTCMRHGFSPRIFHARQQHTIVSLVSAGFGVALVPECVTVMHREGVVYRRMRKDQETVETGVAWRTDNDSATVGAFVSHLPKLR